MALVEIQDKKLPITLTFYKPKKKSNTRTFLLSLLFGASSLTCLSLNYLNSINENFPERNREIAITRNEKEYFVDKFKALSKNEQKYILSSLENHILAKTEIGKTAKSISSSISVPQIEDRSLPLDIYFYSVFQNTITFNQGLRRTQFNQYLKGEPLSLSKYHEEIHAIQDRSSKWDEFETFSGSFIDIQELKIKGRFSKEKAKEFSTKLLNKPDASYGEAKKGFIDLLDQYKKTMDERRIINESQAFLTFCPFTDPDSFYKRLFPYADFREILPRVGKEKFNQTFHRTLELLALLPAVEASEFVGRNGNSVEQYTKAVDQLKSSKGVSNALQLGIERQKKLEKELKGLSHEAASQIDKRTAY